MTVREGSPIVREVEGKKRELFKELSLACGGPSGWTKIQSLICVLFAEPTDSLWEVEDHEWSIFVRAALNMQGAGGHIFTREAWDCGAARTALSLMPIKDLRTFIFDSQQGILIIFGRKMQEHHRYQVVGSAQFLRESLEILFSRRSEEGVILATSLNWIEQEMLDSVISDAKRFGLYDNVLQGLIDAVPRSKRWEG